jgi:hypothetical protein
MKQLCAFAVLAALALPAAAAELTPLGPEIRIDVTQPATFPQCPQTAMAADGSFRVAWALEQSDASFSCAPDGAVFSRRFDAQGRPLEVRARVTATAPAQCLFGLRLGALASNGRLLATWRQAVGKFGEKTAQARWLPPAGGSRALSLPDEDWLVPLASGNLVGFRQLGGQLTAQVFDAQGGELSPAFELNQTPGTFYDVQAMQLGPDQIALSWFGDGPRTEIAAVRRFRLDGTPLGATRRLAPPASFPLLTAGNAGRLLVLWSFGDVVAQGLDARNNPLGPLRQVNLRSTGSQSLVAAASDARGRSLVVWASDRNAATDGTELVGRLVDSEGKSLSPAVPLAADKAGNQGCGSVATDRQGLWVAAWVGDGPQGRGVYVRRFRTE